MTPRNRGFILVLVLVVIAALGLAALGYSEWMLTERQAVELAGRQIQARALAESGVELARVVLSTDAETLDELGGWYDNPTCFRGVLVLDGEDDRSRGRFSLPAVNTEDGSVRFGLENESGKLNLNALVALDKASENAGRKLLMSLPEMTEEIADAILDWLDADDEPRESGAEAEYYSTLDPPYVPKNGPLATIEELLLVRGVTPQLLFGSDAARTGSATSSESSSDEDLIGTDSSTGSGWAPYLTLYSREGNLQSDGSAKIDLNQSDMQTLHEQLSEVLEGAWATYIVAYRQQAQAFEEKENDQAKVETTPSGQLDLSKEGKLKINSVLDLIGQRVRATYQGQTAEVILESPFANEPEAMRTYLPQLMDAVTTTATPTRAGRLNLYYAPQDLLAAIPGMTSEIVDQLVAERASVFSSGEPHSRYEAWLLVEGIATLDEMKALEPFVTAGGAVYRCQSIGFFDQDGPSARIEAVLDATQSPAAVLFWRDLSRLGRGYSLETLGSESTETLGSDAMELGSEAME